MRMTSIAPALALIGLAVAPASAMPFPTLSDAPSATTLVNMGCGPGWTRGPYGHCHPMGGGGYYAYRPYPAPYYHPYAYRPGYRCWWRNGVRVCG